MQSALGLLWKGGRGDQREMFQGENECINACFRGQRFFSAARKLKPRNEFRDWTSIRPRGLPGERLLPERRPFPESRP